MNSEDPSWSGLQPRERPRLSVPIFRLIVEYIGKHSGLVFSDDLLPKVERRLRARLYALGVESFDEYYRVLKYRDHIGREVERATSLLTVHETYFFRELPQLKRLSEHIFPAIYKMKSEKGQRSLKIWSAGCSTGEEVYSLAMLVNQFAKFGDWNVSIIGSDISRHAVETATEGIYGESSFRAFPGEYRACFDAVGATQYSVRDETRRLCRFVHHNLSDTKTSSWAQGCDIILCPNVLIYFDVETRRRVVTSFFKSLLEEGSLLLGHSESLINTFDAFEVSLAGQALVYTKPARRRLSKISLASLYNERDD